MNEQRRSTLTRAARVPMRQLAAFGAVSVSTTLLDFAAFNLLLLATPSPPVLANTISYSLGILASYALNKHFTFSGGGRDKFSHELGLFVLINIVGLALNNVAVALAVAVAGQNALLLNLAKLAAGVLVWTLKFFGFRRWVYPAAVEAVDR